MGDKNNFTATKRLWLLERLDYIRMNAEAIDFEDLQVLRDEIVKMIDGCEAA